MSTSKSHDAKWHEMTGVQKLTWFGKFAVALLTFGFAFPRVMDPHLED